MPSQALFLRLGISAQQQQETLHIYLLETREEAARFARFGGAGRPWAVRFEGGLTGQAMWGRQDGNGYLFMLRCLPILQLQHVRTSLV